MADRTSQPSTQVGPHSAYAANCRFLWNAAVPNKNSLNGADSTSGLKGTDNTGTAGKYRTWGADGPMSFGVTFPTGAYTLVVVHAFPVASRGSAQTIHTASGTGFQCTPYTTGGGVYENYTHRGVADSAQNQVTGVGGFNTNPWVEVFAYTGSQLRRYRKSGSGANTGGTETIGYVNPSTTINLGDNGNLNTQGVYAVMLVAGDIGDTECLALRDNPWRMFEEDGPAGITGSSSITLGPVTSVAAGTVTSGITGASSITLGTVTSVADGSVTGVGAVTGASSITLGAVTSAAAGAVGATLTIGPVKNKSGTVLAGASIGHLVALGRTTRAVAISQAGLTTDGSGMLAVRDSSLVPGTDYMVATWTTDGASAGNAKVTAVAAA